MSGYYDDEKEGGRRTLLWRVMAGGAMVALGVGAYVLTTRDSGPANSNALAPATLVSIADAAATADDDPISTDAPAAASTSLVEDVTATDASTGETAPDPAIATTISAPADTAEVTTTTTRVSQLPPAPTTTAAAEITEPTAVPPPDVTTATPPTEVSVPVQSGPVASLPDGSPVPVVAVLSTNQVLLTGAVPSQAAADRLEALAVANSKTPVVAVNNLVINPDVPINVGVRVIELNSVRFPASSAVIGFEHAVELNRVADIMKALPNVSVLVVGHADQRGNDLTNFAISDARARAVVNYLIGQGIPAERLSSRAVGSTDLLSIDDDSVALTLNRRTEFIFYGLLVES